MSQRFVSIWFPDLITDWFIISTPSLRNTAFVVSTPFHGRMIVVAASPIAQRQGIHSGIALADARAILPDLIVADERPGLAENVLKRLALWSIRFTPLAAVDLPDGLILDVSGCAHLWGGDEPYIKEITNRLETRGYQVRIAMADTIGTAWGLARFGNNSLIAQKGKQLEALLPLPAEALRLEEETRERLHKLGLHQISDFIQLPQSTLRRRFGSPLLQRLHQALGSIEEMIHFVQPIEPYTERLSCLEPIVTNTGIEIALEKVLNAICSRLQKEQKGLRTAVFKAYQINGGIAQIVIETGSPSSNEEHLFKLFQIKLPIIQPESGIELFTLEAKRIEDHLPEQEKFWNGASQSNQKHLSELLDRLSAKIGTECIHRYLPCEHYWPERSFQPASSLKENTNHRWWTEKPRPLILLPSPQSIEVTAPIPDYPPMLFRYKGKLHKILKADGPERLEQEWWIERGEHRDYYYVEDEEGRRYWLFRLGHYDAPRKQGWFIHGFFP